MAITNVGFDGTVSEAQWSKMWRRAVEGGSGQLLWSGGSVTAPGTGRTVSVAAYDAWIAGVWSVGDAATTVLLSANTSGKPRIDYVILDVDWIANTVTVTKVDGSPANNPVAPNLTQTEIGRAHV